MYILKKYSKIKKTPLIYQLLSSSFTYLPITIKELNFSANH